MYTIKMFTTASLSVVVGLLFSMPVQSIGLVEGVKVKNISGSLNVREGPGTHYPVLRRLDGGTSGVEVLGEKRQGRNTWARIKWDDKVGWVSKSYLESFMEFDKGAKYKVDVNGTSLNVRYGPGTSYRQLRTLEDGVGGIKITRLAKKGESYWARISSGGKIGWVSSQYLVADDGNGAAVSTGAEEKGRNNGSLDIGSAGTVAGTYTVVAGDTLYAIMRKTKKHWSAVARLNNIQAPYALSVGTVLKLPM
ncbi:MAG: Unknown protein [uncultured Thiotrichaceae bacterium]|uniref:LysM domain-containing protein n=1 Tax=uncultured Thiotrichaceae bacterium TaxID=298394 RepID=A0A6S6S093_9GAMM|nr:MAG: Unknown protein [uncultured Thiotrichaceae bacterium]